MIERSGAPNKGAIYRSIAKVAVSPASSRRPLNDAYRSLPGWCADSFNSVAAAKRHLARHSRSRRRESLGHRPEKRHVAIEKNRCNIKELEHRAEYDIQPDAPGPGERGLCPIPGIFGSPGLPRRAVRRHPEP